MMITKVQKQYLKGLANPLSSMVTIGKSGLNENVIKSIDDVLEAHELLKINVLKTCEVSANELAVEIVRITHSELVQQIGRKIIIYRPSKEHKIELPK